MDIRTIARRTLLAWWMIPMIWVFAFPIGWMMLPSGDATEITRDICVMLWDGIE